MFLALCIGIVYVPDWNSRDVVVATFRDRRKILRGTLGLENDKLWHNLYECISTKTNVPDELFSESRRDLGQ
jgi:hypothetical protein